MRQSLVQKSSNAFFENKRARTLTDLKNLGGEVIKEGLTVVITGKNHVNKTNLDIQLGEIIMYGINPEHLELVKESDNYWPIESDTLNLRNHEFNFKK